MQKKRNYYKVIVFFIGGKNTKKNVLLRNFFVTYV